MTIPEKFIEGYRKLLNNMGSNKEAFQKASEEWVKKYDMEPPYSSYNSFKRALNYHHYKN